MQYTDNLYWLAPGLLGYGYNWARRRFLAPNSPINRATDRAMQKLTVTVQKLMEVVPEKEE